MNTNDYLIELYDTKSVVKGMFVNTTFKEALKKAEHITDNFDFKDNEEYSVVISVCSNDSEGKVYQLDLVYVEALVF